VASDYLRYVMNNGVRRVRVNQERRAWIVDHLSKMCKTRTTPEEDVAKAEYRAGTIEEVAKLWLVESSNVVSVAHHLQELLQENIEHIARTIRTNTRFTVHEPKEEEEETIHRRVCDACSQLTVDEMIHCKHGEIRPMPVERNEFAVFRGYSISGYEDVSTPPAPATARLIREDRLRTLYDTPAEGALREVGLPSHAENHMPATHQDMFRAYVGGAVGREMFAQAQLEMYRIPLPEEPPEPAYASYDQRTARLSAGAQQYQTWRDAHDTDYVLPDLPALPDESESL
jgi:hypothetical protein